MKNLKKILALVLAFACAFTMFAGAAFTDEADIKAKDAVNMLSALGVIAGYNDGSYKPDATVTRAEMAKMIFVVRNNKADDSAYQNISSKLTDVNNHWARGYIKFCESQGIIAGRGNGKFDPDDTVTGVEAAKMLLVLTGYDVDKAGLTGLNWRTNTLKYAGAAGILEDVLSGLEAGLPRQYAAQMIYNTLDANRVKWSEDSKSFDDVLNGGTKETVGYAYMDLVKEQGILNSVSEDSKGTFSIETSKGNYSKVAEDYTDLLGQKVEVLYKSKNTDKVFGVYATDDNDVAIVTTIGKLDSLKAADKTFEVDGVKTKYAKNIKIVDVTGTAKTAGVADLMRDAGIYNTSSTVLLVSNDGDSNVDVAVVIPSQVAKVTYVGSSSLTLGNSIGSIDFDDIQTYDGIKKNDVVLYTKDADNTYDGDTADKVDFVEGTVQATKGTAAKEGYQIKVDGNWYRVGVTGKNTVASNESVRSGDKVKLAVYEGYFYDVDKNAAASNEDILFVKEAGKIQSGIASGVEASVLFTDGTEKTIVVNKIVDPTNDDNEKDAGAAAVLKGNQTAYRAGTDGKVYVGALYTYEIDGSKYKLTPITDKNMANYDAQGDGTWDGDDDQFAGKRVDDNAVIFVAKKLDDITGADAKVVTGKTLKTWKDYGNYGQFIALKSNGISSVMVGALVNTTDEYGSKSGNYGIVVADPENVRINGTNYVSLSVWNGSENVQMLIKDSTKGDAVKGQAFSYETDGTEKDGDTEIPVIKSYDATTGFHTAAMLGVSADGKKFDVELTDTGVADASTTYKVTEDTTVLFLDGKKGVVGGDLTSYAAMETSIKDHFVLNAYYVIDKDKDLDLLVVAVDGKLKLNDKKLAVSDTASKIGSIDTTKKEITLKAAATLQDLVDEIDYCAFASADKGVYKADVEVVLVNAYGKEETYTVKADTTNTFTVS